MIIMTVLMLNPNLKVVTLYTIIVRTPNHLMYEMLQEKQIFLNLGLQ